MTSAMQEVLVASGALGFFLRRFSLAVSRPSAQLRPANSDCRARQGLGPNGECVRTLRAPQERIRMLSRSLSVAGRPWHFRSQRHWQGTAQPPKVSLLRFLFAHI
jgi:hypothetical protein